MKCLGCKLEHPGNLHCSIAKRLAETAARTAVNTITESELTQEKPVVAPVNTDRHKPGYMAEYMRKRRAAKRSLGA